MVFKHVKLQRTKGIISVFSSTLIERPIAILFLIAFVFCILSGFTGFLTSDIGVSGDLTVMEAETSDFGFSLITGVRFNRQTSMASKVAVLVGERVLKRIKTLFS